MNSTMVSYTTLNLPYFMRDNIAKNKILWPFPTRINFVIDSCASNLCNSMYKFRCTWRLDFFSKSDCLWRADERVFVCWASAGHCSSQPWRRPERRRRLRRLHDVNMGWHILREGLFFSAKTLFGSTTMVLLIHLHRWPPLTFLANPSYLRTLT